MVERAMTDAMLGEATKTALEDAERYGGRHWNIDDCRDALRWAWRDEIKWIVSP